MNNNLEKYAMNKVMLLYPPGKQYQRSEDRAQCNIEDSVISSRIALSLTDGNSYILVNNAEEYYRQLTDALVDIKNEVSSSYVYFAFISLASATLGHSLNLIIDKILNENYQDAIDICKVIAETRKFMPHKLREKMSKPGSEMYIVKMTDCF